MTPAAVTSIALLVFIFTYLGMALGRVPGLAVDRTGIAVMAVAVLLASGTMPFATAGAAIDAPTLVLMFALMILSAQFAAAGVYDACAARITAADVHPRHLLALVIAVAGGLSAVLVNDIVVFAMAPILCLGLRARGLDPRPYLMALAGAGNAGSAASLIGNPQNILIGQAGHLGFWPFLAVCAPPAIAALGCVYGAVWFMWRRELNQPPSPPQMVVHALNGPQTLKALAATVLLLGLFATPLPREIMALAVGAALLVSRRIHSRAIIAAVDWQLLLLIACLFVVTGALASTGIAADLLRAAESYSIAPDSLKTMLPGALLVSNTIGNVPATILILSLWPALTPGALYGLALLMTLAGNLLLVGSLCNLIVAERAAATGVTVTFADFARAGVPMALTSMLIAAIWLWAGGHLPF